MSEKQIKKQYILNRLNWRILGSNVVNKVNNYTNFIAKISRMQLNQVGYDFFDGELTLVYWG